MCGAEVKSLPEGVQRVARVLLDKGHPHAPMLLDQSARAAHQANDALGVVLGQIAKRIVFKRRADAAVVLVIAAGDGRVDERKVETVVGPIGQADAEFVETQPGFLVGGVALLKLLDGSAIAESSSAAKSSTVQGAQ